jgi:hypothetical protein
VEIHEEDTALGPLPGLVGQENMKWELTGQTGLGEQLLALMLINCWVGWNFPSSLSRYLEVITSPMMKIL